MADLREKRVDLILQQLEELPTLPAVALRVLEVAGDDASSAKDVGDLISSDPALSARILQLLHRSDTGIRGNLNSIGRAVLLLGFDAVRNVMLGVTVFETFSSIRPTSKSAFSREDFWKHCVAVGSCAELLAEQIQKVKRLSQAHPMAATDAFVCGLLHDLGKIALDAALPKSFSRVVEACDLLRGDMADVERSVIGLDHMVVGKRLCERWGLPGTVRDCVWLHGQDPSVLSSSVRSPILVNLVTLADQIVREQHLGYSGNYAFSVSRQALLDATGLTPAMVQAASDLLVSRIEPRARSLGLDRTSTTELFQEALARANLELGRVSGQLANKTKKLNVRAQFFEALSRFQSELRPDVPPQLVLEAVAQTAVGVLGVSVAAAFSLPPEQSYAQTLVCDDRGQTLLTSLVDLPGAGKSEDEASPAAGIADATESGADSTPHIAARTGRPTTPRAGEGPVRLAGEDLEWLVSAISPRLPGDKRYWICLTADDCCVGGVVWGAAAGEAERLAATALELVAVANGWAMALRTSQIREEARGMAEQLAESNRRLRAAQGEILRSKTLIAVSEMAAGAAHEMNNPLAVISGRSQLLTQQLADARHKAAAQLIFEQSHRLSAIITELMDFARPETPVLKSTEVSDLIDHAVREAKASNDPADRRLEVTLSDVPLVTVDAKQVSAAVTEVIENAIHATDPKTGQIHLHAGHDPYSNRVVLTVTDNGCGMDEATLKRAFDPFFSAKAAGRRRGLGLAKALRWIEASGGSIRLESRPRQGTRTVILLPASSALTGIDPAATRAATRVS